MATLSQAIVRVPLLTATFAGGLDNGRPGGLRLGLLQWWNRFNIAVPGRVRTVGVGNPALLVGEPLLLLPHPTLLLGQPALALGNGRVG